MSRQRLAKQVKATCGILFCLVNCIAGTFGGFEEENLPQIQLITYKSSLSPQHFESIYIQILYVTTLIREVLDIIGLVQKETVIVFH